jgi:hypothetical protein
MQGVGKKLATRGFRGLEAGIHEAGSLKMRTAQLKMNNHKNNNKKKRSCGLFAASVLHK